MPIQALILLAILAASAIIFTVVFVIVADRELAKPANGERGRGESRPEREGNGTSGESDRMDRERSEAEDGDRGEGGRMDRDAEEAPDAERGEGDDIGRGRGE